MVGSVSSAFPVSAFQTQRRRRIKRLFFLLPRDGGLKRQKVKDSYKEEQQKMYSSIIVRQNGSSIHGSCESAEDAGDSGLSL